MEEGVFALFIFAVTIVAYVIVRAARNGPPSRQRGAAFLCVVLGFVSLLVEVSSWVVAAETQEGEVYIVFGGSVAFWVLAGHLYKRSKSARSVAIELAGLGRSDEEAADVYAACLKEHLGCGEDVLEAACRAFREHGRHKDTIDAAGRLLERKPSSGSALAALVGAYVELGRLKDAERASARFVEANPGSEVAAQALEKIRAMSAVAVAEAPARTLVDLATETPASEWTPIKAKRYARQIVKALRAIDPMAPPPAVSPEEMFVGPDNDIEYRPGAGIPKLRSDFAPPEGPLRADALGPGLVYTAGRLVYYVLTRGRALNPDEKPAALRGIVKGLGAGVEKAILQACDPRPAKRPRSLDDLHDRIQAG